MLFPKVNSVDPSTDLRTKSTTADKHTAAKDFESVLIGQLLQNAFNETEDGGSQTMLEFGRDHLAKVIAQGGGLGLARLIESGLDRAEAK